MHPSPPNLDGPHFVMLWGDRGRTFLIPLKHNEGDVILFRTAEEARDAARETIAGIAYGFGVFRMQETLESSRNV